MAATLNVWHEELRLSSRGFHIVDEPEVKLASVTAHALGFRVIELDLGAIGSKEDLFEAIAMRCQLPPWFGRNWDALLDVLTDLSWAPANGYVFILHGCATLASSVPDVASVFVEVLADARERWTLRRVPFHVLLARPVDQFDLETIVGIQVVCSHLGDHNNRGGILQD